LELKIARMLQDSEDGRFWLTYVIDNKNVDVSDVVVYDKENNKLYSFRGIYFRETCTVNYTNKLGTNIFLIELKNPEISNWWDKFTEEEKRVMMDKLIIDSIL